MGMFSPHSQRIDLGHSALIESLIEYHDSGAYQRDIASVGEQAMDYLTGLPESGEQRAMVLDIDETSLSNNWPRLVDPETGYDEAAWNKAIQDASAPAIQPTLELFKAARERDIGVFFITGRHPDEKAVTELNLQRVGYEGWSEIITEPRDTSNTTLPVFPEAAAFKSAARWSLVERGYRIVLSMGDQRSDLSGGYAHKTFKLPNPFYTII